MRSALSFGEADNASAAINRGDKSQVRNCGGRCRNNRSAVCGRSLDRHSDFELHSVNGIDERDHAGADSIALPNRARTASVQRAGERKRDALPGVVDPELRGRDERLRAARRSLERLIINSGITRNLTSLTC